MRTLRGLYQGGATVWPFIGVSVFPEKGDWNFGIYWYEMLRSKAPDYHATHKACPLILAAKWICNKWIGYTAQSLEENQNCAVRKKSRFYPPCNKNIAFMKANKMMYIFLVKL